MICPLCGKRVMAGKSNSTIVDGKLVHKKCPTTNKKPKQKDPDKQLLIEEVYNQFALYAKGYVKDSGFNHYKLLGQIQKLYDDGFSYKEQLYALKKVVKEQNGFYGYTAVVNKIGSIIARKRVKDGIKRKAEKQKQEPVTFDLSKLLKEGDDEW